VTLPKVDVWRLRDGRAVEFRDFYDSARAITATLP
jgi:ketosteroid isomerase-like protein